MTEQPATCRAGWTGLQVGDNSGAADGVPAELIGILDSIEVPIIERPDCLLVRVSAHFYNTEEEIDRLAEALSKLLPK